MAKGSYDKYYTNGKIELARTGKNVSLKNHFTKSDYFFLSEIGRF